MGITDSHGIVYDFQGSFRVARNQFGFGPVLRYVQVLPDPSDADRQRWDQAVESASVEYSDYHVHNLFLDNCHSHVALALNNNSSSNIDGRASRWNMVKVGWVVWVRGRFVNWKAAAQTLLPTLIIYSVILAVAAVIATPDRQH